MNPTSPAAQALQTKGGAVSFDSLPKPGAPSSVSTEAATMPVVPPVPSIPPKGLNPTPLAKDLTPPPAAAAEQPRRLAPTEEQEARRKQRAEKAAEKAAAVEGLDPQNPPKSGKLEQTSAIDVLACLAEGKHTGLVEFRCGLIWKRVRLFEGAPIGVTSNMGMELIGEHLVKSRLITRDQLHRALQKSERENRPLSNMLVEDGTIEQSKLEEELGRNLGARLNEVLEWRWGTFEFKAQDVEEVDYMPKLDLGELLSAARKKQQDVQSGAQVDEESGEFTPQKKLEEAIDIARSIASSSGKGQIERPFGSK